ncbi:SDR family NAD(P)-dependent oxidoreductase [Sphaerisporangium corydalis]|uniref:SDR family NAD(P)-dependent oxidoreductase n=1 Tax=Sphaerisporangium corydalis TaxID=1441875 RepID=A0ABV9EAD1_9ACTN|nr:SDR family oxidoreductase [Sphaerisporangium corydalis]
MVGRFVDQVVVVAGGASGIGAATAARLATEGARVIVGDIDIEKAEKVAARITGSGGTATAVPYDQADADSIRALVEAALVTYGAVDGLHANAADLNVIGDDGTAADVSMEVFQRTIDVDLRGYLLLTRYVVPHMLERGRGSIVYTSSGAAFAGEAERVCYAMAKAGVNALMRHVASKWGKRGIRSNAVAPGLVLTTSVRESLPEEFRNSVLRRQRSPRLGDPADVAAAVAYLLSADAEWVVGQVLSVDGGTTIR